MTHIHLCILQSLPNTNQQKPVIIVFWNQIKSYIEHSTLAKSLSTGPNVTSLSDQDPAYPIHHDQEWQAGH